MLNKIKNEDLICQPCAREAGLVKSTGHASWYLGKDFSGAAHTSAFETDIPCIVCGTQQCMKHPLIEVEYLRVAEGEDDAEERTSI